MPIQQDYIRRMIEQLGIAFRRVAEMLNVARPEEAQQTLNQFTLDQTGLPLEVIKNLPLSDLQRTLLKDDEVDGVQAQLFAEILTQAALISGEEQEGKLAEKALSMWLWLASDYRGLPLHIPGSGDRIQKLLKQVTDKGDLVQRLWLFWSVGDFRRAGNLLLDTSFSLSEALIEEGNRFSQYLSSIDWPAPELHFSPAEAEDFRQRWQERLNKKQSCNS